MAKSNKINVTVRRTIGAGGSLLLTLPKKFCRQNHLRPGDELAVIFGLHEMILKPSFFDDAPDRASLG